MSGSGTRASIPQRTTETPRETSVVRVADIFVGKDVLELLTSAMYIDPMTIYREYVQNAADAIDDAREKGLLHVDEPGRVDIAFDANSRSVRIRDNGTGIAGRSFVRRLTALGASGKRGTKARGFRGVGRLAGLGYAQELIFRSRVDSEVRISELRWDCRRLREALRESDQDNGIGELISTIVEASRLDLADYPDRFFEVELRGIIRLRGDKLLNPAAVSDYLGQVAPVPFSPGFTFGAEINEALTDLVRLGNLDIHIDGMETPIYRPHEDILAIDDRRSIAFERIEVLNIPSVDGDVAAVGWVLHHDYEGALPPSSPIRGLRLRAGNVQVGDNTLLEELFPETRFNGWSVGEVHVIDRRVRPNGRRDHFEQNAHFHNLVNHLTPTAREISRLCRSSSIKRKWVRDYELHSETVAEKIEVLKQGSLGSTDRSAVALTVEQSLLQMDKIIATDLFHGEETAEFKTQTKRLRSQLARVMGDKADDASPLSHMPEDKRAMYEHLFGLIYDCSTNRLAAKALIDRIMLKVV